MHYVGSSPIKESPIGLIFYRNIPMDSLQGQVKNDLSVTFFIHTYDNV